MNWTEKDFDNTAFVYYQGNGASQLHAAKYLDNSEMVATTGELAQMTTPGISTIPRERLWVYPEIEEIDRHGSMSLMSRIRHWFMGIVVNRPKPKESQSSYKVLYPIDETGSVHQYTVDNSKRSLGQETDIKAHKKRVESLQNMHPHINNIVLYGVSRGAATTFSAMAQNQYKNVKLCVLEGPPATIGAQIKFYFSKWLGKLLYNNFFARLFIGGQHKTDKEKQAMAQIDSFPNDVPLVIVSSKKDWIVQHKSSFNLALGVAAKRILAQEKGEAVAPVYFLQLDHSGHNQYYRPDLSQDASRYQNFIHAVYKSLGLPHIDEYAVKGASELKTAELTNGVLKEQVGAHYLFKKHKEERQSIRWHAFQKVRHTLSELEPEEQQRAISMCSSMSLYSKHRNPHTLFGKTNTQKELEMLMPDSVEFKVK